MNDKRKYYKFINIYVNIYMYIIYLRMFLIELVFRFSTVWSKKTAYFTSLRIVMKIFECLIFFKHVIESYFKVLKT
jgi:hypothetical protein